MTSPGGGKSEKGLTVEILAVRELAGATNGVRRECHGFD
jgi:hypothetical protein